MPLRDTMQQLTPPLFVDWFREAKRRLRGQPKPGFAGDYAAWDEAVADSTGYDSREILEKTRAALIEVRDGRAAYERDSVLFDQIEYSWPLAAGLLRVAALDGGRLNVLDFGGSLGSSYFQNRQLLEGLESVRWNIVEQPEHVRVGKESFESDQLRFFYTVDECIADANPNVVFLGSVLHYLEDPYTTLRRLLSLTIDHVIIDRTPFQDHERDRLTVHQVEPYIYNASYPCWLFSRSRFAEAVARAGFRVVAEFPALDAITGPVPVTYRGMILQRNLAPVSREERS